MKKPFNIFPSIGYRNSQFQVISSVDGLKIDLYSQDKIFKSVKVDSNNPIILMNLKITGEVIAKCSLNNKVFQQKLEVKRSFRLGSSEFKKAFVFEDTKYSFFLMKDRLLLYNEEIKQLLTENHYSPTDIYKLNENNFLFVTKVSSSSESIVNFGIYNTESFRLEGELLNDYDEIKILPDSNKIWLYNIKFKTICCFELICKSNEYLKELIHFKEYDDYFIDNNNNIYIISDKSVKIQNLINLHICFEVAKNTNNAIDRLGNIYTFENSILKCSNLLSNYFETLDLDFKLNLQTENFIHIGKELQSKNESVELNDKIEEIKKELVSSIPDNKSIHRHVFPESQKELKTYNSHKIYSTRNGIFIILNKIKISINSLNFKKDENEWIVKPSKTESVCKSTLLFYKSGKVEVLTDKILNIKVSYYENDILILNYIDTKILFLGNNKMILNRYDLTKMFTINDINYLLINAEGSYSLFRLSNIYEAILKEIKIYNLKYFKNNQVIWYVDKGRDVSDTRYLNAFDLKTCTKVYIDETIFEYSLSKKSLDFKFFEGYALSPNQIIFNPNTFEMRDSFIGNIDSYSKRLNKIVSYRNNNFYLSKFNSQHGKYEITEILTDYKKYQESYLSPNGQFLVLKDETNTYSFYDIEKCKVINLISGNFLAFKNDGSLIIEQDNRRAAKIIDPETFNDVTPSNYYYYKFLSPDGKLYASTSTESKFYNKLSNKYICTNGDKVLHQWLNEMIIYFRKKRYEGVSVEEYRKRLFRYSKDNFIKIGIDSYDQIDCDNFLKKVKFIKIGIVGTNIFAEVLVPTDLMYYNYSAFSYDNKYFGYVGKPSSKGLIYFFKINFNKVNLTIEIENTYLSRYPNYASWVCGFSKTGYFATYDSTPDTYIIEVDDKLFVNKSSKSKAIPNINIIKQKNFLCFSPSGEFLALSEQGYEPLTLGGYGHQESNIVQIAKTNTGEIINSFTDHGDRIKVDKNKSITFVSFSEDEKKLMTLSSDGVIVIRDLNILDFNLNLNKERMPTANTVYKQVADFVV